VPFVAVGLSHKTAPVAIREQAYIPESGVGECVRRLMDRALIDAGVMLSTCNRTELYAVAGSPTADDRLMEAFGWWPHQLPFESWRRYAYHLQGDDAIAHLFRVAAGLDSMVIGEAQVLGQLKQAFELARQARVMDPTLHIVVRGAIRAAKRIRQETELGRHAVSVAHAAVTQARAVLRDLKGRGVLVVGAGPMSEVALRLFRNQGVGAVYLASRSREPVERLAATTGGQVVGMDKLEDVIDGVDVILTSTSATDIVLAAPRIAAFQERRGWRPLAILDIAVPRDVEPDAARVAGVRLLNIDDLREALTRNLARRQAAVPLAERIIAEELARTRADLQARQAAPVIRALVERVEGIRDKEVQRAAANLPDDDTRGRAALQQLAEGLTAKFLDGPVRLLRDGPDPALDRTVIREAFALEPEDREG
jgi:glutamyl-tRNA reductase